MERRGKPTYPAPNHRYPPIELLNGVKVIGKKFVAEDITVVPTINGIPDIRATLEELGRDRLIYDEQYVQSIDLSYFNNHHGARDKSDYLEFGGGSDEFAYREDPSLRADMFIPFHDLEHLTKRKSGLADREVMRSRGRELRTVERLFRVLETLTWLESMHGEGAQQYATAVDYIERNGLRTNIPMQQRRSYLIASGKMSEKSQARRFKLPTYTMFLDELNHAKDPEWGILPDREMLASVSQTDALEILARIATRQAEFSVEESTAIIIEASRRAALGLAA